MVDLQSDTLRNHFTSRVGTDFYSSKRLQTLFFVTSFPGTVCLICFAQIATLFYIPTAQCKGAKIESQRPKVLEKNQFTKVFFLTIALTLHALLMCFMVCLFLNGTVAVTVHIEPLIATLSFILIVSSVSVKLQGSQNETQGVGMFGGVSIVLSVSRTVLTLPFSSRRTMMGLSYF